MPAAKRRWLCSGQSLLEVTISIGIAVIVITALAIVSISGLKNAQFSQNQATATKLAQEWIDKVRTIRDRDGMVCNPGVYYHWNALWTTSCGSAAGASCYTFQVKDTSPACSGTPAGYSSVAPWLNLQAAGATTPDPTYPQFQKQLFIEDYLAGDPTQKKVTVTVSWTDFSGTHQSQLVTILTKQ